MARTLGPTIERSSVQRQAGVLVADRYPILRAGIRSALEDAGFDVVAEVSDLVAAVEICSERHPDVCVLGARLHRTVGTAVHRLRQAAPDVSILVLAETPGHAELIEAVRAGACGYLDRDLDLEQLPRAVSAVVLGEAAIPRRFVSRLLYELQLNASPRIPRPRFPELTKREQEVVEMLRAGWSTARIADHLFVAPVTVRTHVSAILGKLRLPNRAALLDLASPGSRTPVSAVHQPEVGVRQTGSRHPRLQS